MRPITARVAFAASCAMLLALTACSGEVDEGDDGGGTPSAEWTPGPLDEYQAKAQGWSLDQDERTQEEMQAESDRENREVEELVATCMREEGFDYTPTDQGNGVVMNDDDLDVEWGSREFAETYGYGISTEPWGPMDTGNADEWSDPNQEYTESMSESELAAYNEALWGPAIEASEDGLDDEAQEWDWTTGGCYGSAQHEVYEDGVELDEFSALTDEIQDFWETVTTDSRMVGLDTSWASCMADAGYDGLTGADVSQQPLYDEWNELQGWDDPEFQALQDSWDWDAEPDGPPVPEPDAAAVEAFTAKEIAMAVADVDCKSDLDYDATRRKVDHELQQAFVDQHKAELDAWVEAATAARDA